MKRSGGNPEVVRLTATSDPGVWDLHKIVERHHLKNNCGDSHSRKKRTVPVDAWPVSNNIPWGTPRKNTGRLTKALRAGAYCCKGFTCWEHVAIKISDGGESKNKPF